MEVPIDTCPSTMSPLSLTNLQIASVATGLISQAYWEQSKWYFVNVERGNIGLALLWRKIKKGKICFVIHIAGKRIFIIFCYDVIVKQKLYKRPTNHYCSCPERCPPPLYSVFPLPCPLVTCLKANLASLKAWQLRNEGRAAQYHYQKPQESSFITRNLRESSFFRNTEQYSFFSNTEQY